MALIVGDLLQSLQMEAGDNPPNPMLALDWLQQRYESVLTRAPWPFMIKEATFQTIAEITAGTVTVTNGSATVTETTSNANGWSSSVESRFYRRDTSVSKPGVSILAIDITSRTSEASE